MINHELIEMCLLSVGKSAWLGFDMAQDFFMGGVVLQISSFFLPIANLALEDNAAP